MNEQNVLWIEDKKFIVIETAKSRMVLDFQTPKYIRINPLNKEDKINNLHQMEIHSYETELKKIFTFCVFIKISLNPIFVAWKKIRFLWR